MIRIVIDAALEDTLRAAEEQAELCNSAGEVLGLFLPKADRSMYERAKPPSSDAEIQRRLKAGGGRTLAEIMADLQKRT